MGKAEKIELAQALQERADRKKYNALKHYSPYDKQQEFHSNGTKYPQRLLGAGSQTGKTYCGSREAAMHLTGQYPDWWDGLVFENPIIIWIGGVSGEIIRDSTQKLLVGRMQDKDSIGTEAIPRDCIIETVRALGVRDLLDHVKVKHVTGGTSLCFFKSYEKGREKFQAETIDIFWPDEEPPQDIYSEGMTRTNKGQNGQCGMMTFTPLKGMSTIVYEFYQAPSKYQKLTQMTIHDVDHYTDEEKEQIIESYPEHERDARAKGIPVLGSGRIFPIKEEDITCDPFEIPAHYAQINGLDFGWDHPQACVNIAWDRDEDIVYVTKEYRESEKTPEEAAIPIRRWGDWIPTAWPHDGYQHDKGSGKGLASQYGDAGLNMLGEHATHEEGGNGVEAGIMSMLDRMKSGNFKVFSTCNLWFEEYRLYHRKDGKIVKERDDLMAATRYAMMMLRKAVTHKTKNTKPIKFASLFS
jgi:phage terminase large subunit-like protein